MTISKPPLILIVGPTAVGKTELAIRLAEKFKGEIVSADSRLFYRGMDIGTAKPSRIEMARVPHYLINIVDPDETLSLAVFQQKAKEIITDIHARGKLPFLVGGTGQYVRAVTQGWTPPEVTPDERLRGVLEKVKEEKGVNWLHDRLRLLDQESAEKIDARNARRRCARASARSAAIQSSSISSAQRAGTRRRSASAWCLKRNDSEIVTLLLSIWLTSQHSA